MRYTSPGTGRPKIYWGSTSFDAPMHCKRTFRLGSPEQAWRDPRRNVLLQCIGASKLVEPQYIFGRPVPGEVYLMCSDGFRHTITADEIYRAFKPDELQGETEMIRRAKGMVELNKQRQETDNISVLLVKIQ